MLPYSLQCTFLYIGTRGQCITYLLAWASALHRFDWMGNARASKSGTGNKYGLPRFFVCVREQDHLPLPLRGSWRRDVCIYMKSDKKNEKEYPLASFLDLEKSIISSKDLNAAEKLFDVAIVTPVLYAIEKADKVVENITGKGLIERKVKSMEKEEEEKKNHYWRWAGKKLLWGTGKGILGALGVNIFSGDSSNS